MKWSVGCYFILKPFTSFSLFLFSPQRLQQDGGGEHDEAAVLPLQRPERHRLEELVVVRLGVVVLEDGPGEDVGVGRGEVVQPRPGVGALQRLQPREVREVGQFEPVEQEAHGGVGGVPAGDNFFIFCVDFLPVKRAGRKMDFFFSYFPVLGTPCPSTAI